MAQFKTRARTVDMLGRQQIANVSTAISELFKNAHDAYADHAEVDYFRSDNLLVVRDDGVGMTLEEFENRWLVLGTESKYVPDGGAVDTYRPAHKLERVTMGEKGIGRLAIALLGRQVLVLTRAERYGRLSDLVMCFIHWELFEITRINLDEIEIPVRTVEGGRMPTAEDVEGLIGELRENVEGLASKYQLSAFESILNDLEDFQLDPSDMDDFLGGITLRDHGCGTHFYVAPADEGIAYEIENERQKNTRDFSKFLLGFSNSVFRESPPPPIETAFRYWPTDAVQEDIISEGEFFTPRELDMADHRISGKFDEFGQFQGDIRVYEEEIENHVIPWKGGGGNPTNCGPFEIEFGYVAGRQRESRLDPDEWKRITDKLNQIGGIYVYRDRIRILPYGNSDVDWLDIEERRTKSAAYYFFSHRRMFGAVKLTREHNGLLKEKAGREGFQQDKAYRQLTSILENFVLQLTADFFREAGDYSDYFSSRKAELEKAELARRKREKQVSTRRRNLAASLDGFFQRVEQSLPEAELATLRELIRQRMESAAKMDDPDQAAAALLDAEREANRRLSAIRENYRLTKPRGVGLPRTLQRDWEAYRNEQERLESEVFVPFTNEVAKTLGMVAKEARLYVDQRLRLSELIKQQADAEKKNISQEAGQLRKTANNARSAALRCAREAIRELQEAISDVEVDFAHRNLAGLSEEQIEHIRGEFEGRIGSVGRKNAQTLGSVRDMLTAIASNLREGATITESDMIEAMDQELQELKEQSDADAELVQLGLAVAVINHEFEAAIKGVRRSLRELHPWVAENSELGALYQQIRTNFDHLDGHLNLFTPLQRRLYRKAIPIKGGDIHHYVRTLFDGRLKRHQIDLTVSEAFLGTEIHGFPSTVYPVFVNILDNAIFWLTNIKGEKLIALDADDGAFLISNNGPAIHRRDYEAIFEQGFTRKPGGRGLGMFISKKALNREGMDISVVAPRNDYTVTLRIKWPEHDNDS